MKEAHFNAWIKALRSGQWRQGRYALETKDGHFCCLGVMARVDRWSGVKRIELEQCVRYRHKDIFSDQAPAMGYQEALRLPRGLVQELIDMNDVHGCDFNQIADYLEARKHDIVETT